MKNDEAVEEERGAAERDMRKGRRPELEESPLAWYPRLCDDICAALNKGLPSDKREAK